MSDAISIKEALDAYADTNHPGLLAVRAEITALVNADADTLFAVAEAGLKTIYDEAEKREDYSTMQLAADAYGSVKELYQVSDQLTGVAVASRAAMDKAVEERDDLVDAIDRQDPDHEMVGELIALVREDALEDMDDVIEDAREEAREEAADSAYEAASDMAYQDALDNLRVLLRLDYGTARRFAYVVTQGYLGMGADKISEGELLEIGEFIERTLSENIYG